MKICNCRIRWGFFCHCLIIFKNQFHEKKFFFVLLFRTIYGKLCFGYEECNQFEEAEKAGAIALNHTPNDIWAIHSMTHVKEETLR